MTKHAAAAQNICAVTAPTVARITHLLELVQPLAKQKPDNILENKRKLLTDSLNLLEVCRTQLQARSVAFPLLSSAPPVIPQNSDLDAQIVAQRRKLVKRVVEIFRLRKVQVVRQGLTSVQYRIAHVSLPPIHQISVNGTFT